MKLEIVVPDDRAEEVIQIVMAAARTGEIGDGKLFVSRVEEAVRIEQGARRRRALSGCHGDIGPAPLNRRGAADSEIRWQRSGHPAGYTNRPSSSDFLQKSAHEHFRKMPHGVTSFISRNVADTGM